MSNLYDIKSEYQLLALAFDSEDHFSDICTQFSTEDFFGEEHKILFDAYFSIFNHKTSLNINLLRMTLRDYMTKVGGDVFLTQLANEQMTYEFDYLKKIVKEKTQRRKLTMLSHNVIKQMNSDCDFSDISGSILTKFTDVIDENSEKSMFSLAELVEKYDPYKKYVKNKDLLEKGLLRDDLIYSNFKDMDNTIGGFHKGRVAIIGARPGEGKTTIALNIANNMKKKKTLFFSLEMTSEELMLKLALMNAGLSYDKYDNCMLNQDELHQLYGESKKLRDVKLMIDDTPSLSPNQILSRANRVRSLWGLDIIFIDYVQLMSGNEKKYESNEVKIRAISKELKVIAKRLDVPIICLAQLNRMVTQRTSNIPFKEDLRESGGLEQDADLIMLLYPDDKDSSVLNINIDKNRYGAKKIISLKWIKNISKIENLGS